MLILIENIHLYHSQLIPVLYWLKNTFHAKKGSIFFVIRGSPCVSRTPRRLPCKLQHRVQWGKIWSKCRIFSIFVFCVGCAQKSKKPMLAWIEWSFSTYFDISPFYIILYGKYTFLANISELHRPFWLKLALPQSFTVPKSRAKFQADRASCWHSCHRASCTNHWCRGLYGSNA